MGSGAGKKKKEEERITRMLPLCRVKRAWYFDLYREKEKDPFSDSKVLSKQLPHFMF